MDLFNCVKICDGVFQLEETYYQSWNKAHMYFFKGILKGHECFTIEKVKFWLAMAIHCNFYCICCGR